MDLAASPGTMTMTGLVGTFSVTAAEVILVNGVATAPRPTQKAAFHNVARGVGLAARPTSSAVFEDVARGGSVAPRPTIKTVIRLVTYTQQDFTAPPGKMVMIGTVGTFDIPDLLYLSGKSVAPRPTIKTDIDVPILARAKMGFGPFMTRAAALVPFGAVGVMGFGPFAMTGDIFIPPFKAVGQMGFPQFGMKGVIAVPPVINARMGFPAFEISGRLEGQYKFDGVIGFSAFAMSGTLDLDGQQMLGNMMFPQFGMKGLLEVPTPPAPEYTGVAAAPSFALSGNGFTVGGGLFVGSDEFYLG